MTQVENISGVKAQPETIPQRLKDSVAYLAMMVPAVIGTIAALASGEYGYAVAGVGTGIVLGSIAEDHKERHQKTDI